MADGRLRKQKGKQSLRTKPSNAVTTILLQFQAFWERLTIQKVIRGQISVVMVKTNDKKKNTVFINKAEKKKFATEKLKYKTYLN